MTSGYPHRRYGVWYGACYYSGMIINLVFWRGLFVFPYQKYRVEEPLGYFDHVHIMKHGELILPPGARYKIGKAIFSV